jgi:hypothetical protein
VQHEDYIFGVGHKALNQGVTMFSFNPESFKSNFHGNAKAGVELSRRVLDAQLAVYKHSEKLVMEGLELNRKSLESAAELSKASWSVWLDMLAPKTEAKA